MKSFGCYIDEPPMLEESEYQGKKVTLNNPPLHTLERVKCFTKSYARNK